MAFVSAVRHVDARRATLVAATATLALIPLVRMIMLILDGTHLQYADYWPMIDKVLQPGGGLDVGELFTFRNEHPIVFGQLFYWLNAHLADGSNISLGLVVVVMVAASLGLVAMIARSTFPRSALVPSAVIVVSSALLFSLKGSWNFYKAMSGTAWLMANLFTLLALWLQSTNRRWPAVAAAVAASASYGTGIVVWPALALAGMVQNRRWYPAPEFVAGFGLTALWHLLASDGATPGGLPLIDRARVAVRLIGSIFVENPSTFQWGAAELLGWIAVLSGIGLALWAARDHRQAAPWVGLLVYGLTTNGLIAQGRSGVLVFFGNTDRYTSLAALTWIAWFALAAAWIQTWLRPRLGTVRWRARLTSGAVLVLALAVFAGSTLTYRSKPDEVRQGARRQDQLDIALRFGLADGSSMLFESFPAVTETLRSVGHYPFNGSTANDCGLAGQSLSETGIELDAATAGSFSMPAPNETFADSVGFTVTIPDRVGDFDCIVVLDAESTIVGAASPPVQEGGRNHRALARAGGEPYTVHVLLPDGSNLTVPPAEASS